MAKRSDWEQVERDYVEGVADSSGAITYPSQRELAEKYNISVGLIGRHAKKEQWATKREIFSSRVTEKRQQKKVETISDEGRSFDLACFNLAENLRSEIDEMLLKDGIATPKNLSLLTASLKNLQAVGKAALGDDKSSEQELSINITMGDAE